VPDPAWFMMVVVVCKYQSGVGCHPRGPWPFIDINDQSRILCISSITITQVKWCVIQCIFSNIGSSVASVYFLV
jgi:hypothetical protein